MKKLSLILLFLLFFGVSFSQNIANRSNSTVTVSDARLQAGLNLFVPRYADTTAANVQKGIDSCGALIFTYDINGYWVRGCSPKIWIQIATGSSGLLFARDDPRNNSGGPLYFSAADESFTIDSVNNFNVNATSGSMNFVSAGGVTIHGGNGSGSTLVVDNLDVTLSGADSIRLVYPNTTPTLSTLGDYKFQVRSPGGGFADYTGIVGQRFGVEDNLATANRLFDQSTYKFQFGGGGQTVFGNDQFTSMNARVRIQAPYSQNYMFIGDSTQNTANNIGDFMMRRIDTFTVANLSTRKFSLASFERVIRPANNMFMSNYYAGFGNSYIIEPQDSVRITSQGGDFSVAQTNGLIFRKLPGWNAKTIVSAHTSDSPVEIVPAQVNLVQTYGSTSLTNNFRVRGWYGGSVSHLLIPTNDSLVGQYAGFFAHAAVDGYVKKYYSFFDSGSGDLQIDSTFGFWSPSSRGRSWIGGDFHVGGGVTSVNSYMGGINPASSVFEVEETTKGSRPAPTMTSAQMLAISSPATGLMVYCTDSTSYCYYTGSVWLKMTGSGAGSSTTIYTGDGTVSGNRTIAGGTNTIAFNDFSEFTFNDGTRDRLQIRTTKTQIYDPAGVRTIVLNDSVLVQGLDNVIDTVRRKVLTIDPITNTVAYSPWLFAGSGSYTNGYGLNLVSTTFSADSTKLLDKTATNIITGSQLFASAPLPAWNDAVAIGSTSLKFSDLFLASGAVINFNSGNAGITHSTGILTFNGAGYFGGGAKITGDMATFSGAGLEMRVNSGTQYLSAFDRGGGNYMPIIMAGTTQTFQTSTFSSAVTTLTLSSAANVGIGNITSPSARLHLPAGTATASTAPFKLTTGTSNTTAEAGAMEYTTPQLFFTNGAAIRQELFQGQQSRVSTQFDKTDVTLANITGLTANVAAGKIYRFEATLYTTSNVGGGVKVAIAGTATATNIIYEGLTTDAGVTTQSRGAALATAVGAVTAVTAAYIVVTGTITVNAAGTLTVQFAENVATATSSVLVGSTFVVTEML